MQISQNIRYIGVNDRKIDLFEGMYKVPNGIAYNSYVILDEKIAVMDTVDAAFQGEWLLNLQAVLQGRVPDYLIVQHMEPDHSACIAAFMGKYPGTKIVASARAVAMIGNYFRDDFSARTIVVADGDTLSLGEEILTFIAAPMVHWPEVIMTYLQKAKVLFSADAFGKFGTTDTKEDWACEARRYYFGIVGKYGVQVQSVLKKLSALQVDAICPLHGTVLNENLGDYLHLYNVWSSYGVESQGVMIVYTSVYGNTRKAVELLSSELIQNGCEKVVVADLARCDMSEAVEDAFRYGKIVFASTTYNGGVFPFMREFLSDLAERNFQNRTVAYIENGSWAPMAAKKMQDALSGCKNLTMCAPPIQIVSAMSDENVMQIKDLAKELCK